MTSQGDRRQRRRLSDLEINRLSPAALSTLYTSLGIWLRDLQQEQSPEGFGDPDAGNHFQTVNAFLSAEFRVLGLRLKALENEVLRQTALELLITLRHEMSSFHPHGRSVWSLGEITPERILLSQDEWRVCGALDPEKRALRLPEYDLAALKAYGVFQQRELAERSFWKGYGAAMTRDLERRLRFFERLIELERLLGRPAMIPRPLSRL